MGDGLDARDAAWPDLLFWLGEPAEPGSRVALDADESHHLLKVTRRRPGETVVLADGAGNWLSAVLLGVKRGSAELEVRSRRPSPAEPRRRLSLGFPPLRPGRSEFILEKGTELGVTRFVPLRTKRTLPGRARSERWARIVRGAAMQSLRASLPEISGELPLEEWLGAPESGEERWVARPGGVPGARSAGGDLVALVGPEGDFTGGEWNMIEAAGFRPLDLGPRRLRAETAALVLVSRLTVPAIPGC